MTALEQAKAALGSFRADVAAGHPWIPGGVFINNPGLDKHILAALEDWVVQKGVVRNGEDVDKRSP